MWDSLLTVLEASASNNASDNNKGKKVKKHKRDNAAEKYNISKTVLETLGKLVTLKGDRQNARKVPGNGEYSPLSPVEKNWVIEVIKKMILRVGEYNFNQKNGSNKSLPEITMLDLPNLPK